MKASDVLSYEIIETELSSWAFISSPLIKKNLSIICTSDESRCFYTVYCALAMHFNKTCHAIRLLIEQNKEKLKIVSSGTYVVSIMKHWSPCWHVTCTQGFHLGVRVSFWLSDFIFIAFFFLHWCSLSQLEQAADISRATSPFPFVCGLSKKVTVEKKVSNWQQYSKVTTNTCVICCNQSQSRRKHVSVWFHESQNFRQTPAFSQFDQLMETSF